MHVKKYVLVGLCGVLALAVGAFIVHRRWHAVPPDALAYEHDWCVDVDKNSLKSADEYDVIVIGSGFGGLSSGALLAQDGFKVLVLERASYLGGYGATWQEKGFSFSWGAEDVSGIWQRGPVSYLLKQLGLEQDKLFKPIARRIIAHGRTIDVAAGPDEFQKSLIREFPTQKDAIDKFFNDARAVYLEAFDEPTAGCFGVPPLGKYSLKKMVGTLDMLRYPWTHARMLSWMKTPLQQKLDEYFADDDLKTVLKALLGYVGANSKSPAGFVVVALFDYFAFGSYYPLGGPGHFAQTLASCIEKHGGTVLTGHEVTRVLVQENAVQGVLVGDKKYVAPVVIANVNAPVLYKRLVDPNCLPKRFLKEFDELKLGHSTLGVYLGLNMNLSQYPVFVRDMDNRVHLLLSSNGDPALAPRGKACLTFYVSAELEGYPAPDSPEYKPHTEKLVQEALERVEKVIPGIKKRIAFRRYMTPYDFARAVDVPQGAVYTFASSKRPFFKAPIKGLYLSSSSTTGGGVVGTVMAGITAFHDIRGWKKPA